MAKSFLIPEIYESPVIRRIKEFRAEQDGMKKDMRPAVLDFGPIRFLIPRHFGFCYGVQNAIDIAYKTITSYLSSLKSICGQMCFETSAFSTVLYPRTVNQPEVMEGDIANGAM